MTADEALALVETVLDGKRLNDVQELIFKQCWEGRQSYKEIARIYSYDDEYIKYIAGKLWKLLSKGFDDNVKRNNLKSVVNGYLRRHQVNSQRNQLMGINLSGADLSGSILCFANLNGANSYPANLDNAIKADQTTSDSCDEKIQDENGNNQGIESNREERLYHWNDLRFHCEEQVKIAEALDRANIFFFPNSKARLTTPEGRQNQEPDFLIFHQGKLGILEIWHPDTQKNEERDRDFASAGICTIYYCEAHRCSQEADRVVQEFLEILSHA
ncbi:MAG: pentapeptide repeat-containing protein [Microcoleus sp.]